MTGKLPSPVVHLFVESKVRVRLSELGERAARTVLAATTYRDPLYAQRKAQGISTYGLTPRICTSELREDMLLVWRGVLGRLLRSLKAAGRSYQVHDNRLWLPRLELRHSIELRDYQVDPVAAMVRRQQTVGRGPAGCGKTEMLLHAAAHFQQPTLVLVWQERQQQVWCERVPKWFGFDAGGIGGAFKTPQLAPITVGMVQSVRRRLEDIKWRFGCVICDEVSRFAAPTLSEVINNMPAAVRLGASDDERRRDGREFLLYDTFGPKGWHLGKSTGQCDVDVLAVPTGLRLEVVPEDWPSLIERLTVDPMRNRLVLDLAEREARAGHRVLIWSDRVGHCRLLKDALLRRSIKAGLLIGGKANKPEADRTERGLASGNISVGIGTTVAEQSINIRPLDRGIMTCASADRKLLRFRQMRGRLARPYEDKHSRLYYLWDRRVPVLRRRVYNIKRRYPVRVVRQAKEEPMAEKMAVTLETLKVGCKLLGIKYPREANTKKLEELIKRELGKNKTYGSYCCGACFNDIVDRLPVCPFCAAKFKPVPDEVVEEPEAEEPEVEEEEPEAEQEEEPAEEEPAEEYEEETADDEEYEEEPEEQEEEEQEEVEDDDGESPSDEELDNDEPEEQEEEQEEEEQEEPEEQEEEEEEPPRRPAPKPVADKAKQKELVAKREQVRSELPYTEKQLKAMKRTVLVMIAGVLGHKDPVKLGSTEALIKYITKAQAGYQQPEQKPVVRKVKPAAKPAPAAKPKVATGKPAVKPKARR